MAKMSWDQMGEKRYETGVEQCAFFPMVDKAYGAGEPWNGLIGITESPSGAEATALYANDAKYGELTSAEDFGGTIEAYTYPDGFAACNGEEEIVKGFTIGQQPRVPFGLAYKTLIGNDTQGTKYGHKLVLVYGAKATPSENANTTVNESPEAKTMSWEFTTTPVPVPGYNPASKLTFDSTKVDAEKLKQLEAIIYGSEEAEPRLPLPEEVINIMKVAAA